MKYFDIGEERYHLRHHNDDDSRTVVRCEDFSFAVLLKFDSNLNIFNEEGKRCGRLKGYTGKWVLVMEDGEERDLNVSSFDYDWQALVKAEVEAAKVLLS
jgi:hypothetical protein